MNEDRRRAIVASGEWPRTLYGTLGVIVGASREAAEIFQMAVEEWRQRLPSHEVDATLRDMAEITKRAEDKVIAKGLGLP